MPVLATAGGHRRLMVLHSAAVAPSASNWQKQQEQDSELPLGGRIAMWVLFSITVIFFIITAHRICCSRSHGRSRPRRNSGDGGRELNSGEGSREHMQQPVVAGDIELAPEPPLEYTYRSSDGSKEEMCSVCLSELADGEVVWLLAVCKHCFHAACVEQWLRERATCPLCRAPSAAGQGRQELEDPNLSS